MRGGGRGRGGDDARLPDDPEFRAARSSRRRFAAFLRLWRGGTIGLPGGEPATGTVASRRRDHLRRYWRWLRPARWRILLVLGLGVLVAVLDACWPLITGWIIDLSAPGHGKGLPALLDGVVGPGGLLVLAALALAVILVARLIGLWRGYLQSSLSASLVQRLRRQLYARMIHLPLRSLHDMKTGGIQSRLSGDVDGTSGLVQQAIISPVTAALRLLVVVIVLLSIDWQLTMLALGLLALCGLVYHRFVRRIRPVWRIMRAQRGEIDGRLSEVFSGIRVVRTFIREPREQLSYGVGHHAVTREDIWTQRKMQLLFFFWEVLLPLVSLTIIALGGWFVMQGRLRIGEVVTMQILSFQVLNPVLMIVRAVTDTQRGLASMDRVYEVLDQEVEMPDRPDAMAAPSAVQTLRFEHVDFAYDADEHTDDEPTWVLRDIDLTVPGGSVLALVGPSGSGKTTITNLVARLYDPTRGQVCVNGVDLRDLRLRSYRSLLGIVEQDVFLFDGSIAENIAYGRPGAEREAIIAAARHANAWEFIEPLPEGLDAVIGERGVKLSGGQRQRLAIARAMLADPAILILDEATSNLDSHSERLIQQAMEELMRDRTTVVIAHRLDTIRHADIIVVLDRGRIVETGDHQSLMADDGLYADMVRCQTNGLLGQ